MTYSGKIPVLGFDGYPYWKGRMEAFLVSQSQDIWDATQSTTFVVLPVAERTTQDIVAQHEANAKAVNFLFSGLGPMDYERVSHLKTAREIWSLLVHTMRVLRQLRLDLWRLTGANMRISSRSRESQ